MLQERFDRWVRGHPVAVDAVLVTALLIFPGVPTLVLEVLNWQSRVLIVLLQTVPLAWRRTRPGLSTGLVFGAAFTHFLAGVELLPSDVTVFVALYAVAAYGNQVQARLGLAFSLVGAGMVAVATARKDYARSFLVDVVLIALVGCGFALAVWVAGSLRGTRRAYLDALEERADRLEIEREQQSRLATAAERARIARELHDVVAHSLSVIIAQADGGRYAARSDSQAAVRALEIVSGTGRTALTDMRRLLGVLRDGEQDSRGPQPGIGAVADLVTSVRSSGLTVGLAEVGRPRDVGDGLGLAAYRIVQEALTNVLKHGGPAARASVQVSWEADAVRLVVEDDGRGASASDDGRGQGLGGMRERARLYGGRVDAGPRPGGGFRVHALLPYPRPGTAMRESGNGG
ncbi:MAG TPA: sensor histidine kinase [Kineosporiaceae bacterium]|nr:sensor histidine kinase [Kineosporiaceae bacterium]